MFTYHVILLPVIVVALAAWHVLLVRRHGVVPPYSARAAGLVRAEGAGGTGPPDTAAGVKPRAQPTVAPEDQRE